MSIFSSSVRTQIIDPTFHSENRAEFRLSGRGVAYLPTLRLGNIGLKKTAGFDNEYHFGCGAASIISRISLLDGNEQLDSLKSCAQWLTFKRMQKSNSENVNVFSDLEGGRVGWSAGASGDLLANEPKLVSQGAESTLGSLDLRECFPFLNNVSHLSTKLFKNLRVVVEYVPNSQVGLLLNNQTNVAGLAKTVPILMADEITDDALVATLDSQLNNANWVAVETDNATIPAVPGVEGAAIATAVQQRTSLRINGFQNKAVSRVMVAKTFTDADAYKYIIPTGAPNAGNTANKGLASYGSRALHKERFNMRINGRNVMSGDGLTSPAQTTMMLTDVWGELDMCQGQNTESVGLDTKYGLVVPNATTATIVGHGPYNWVGSPRTEPRVQENGGVLNTADTAWGTPPTAQQGVWIGNSAFIGVPVHDRVTDMQLDLVRTGTPSSVTSGAGLFDAGSISSAGNYLGLTLNVFAEVSKQMEVRNGEYIISYA